MVVLADYSAVAVKGCPLSSQLVMNIGFFIVALS